MMPRRKKFQPGDVVAYTRYPDPIFYAVVVGYRQDAKGRGEYRLVRVNRAVAGQLYGHTFWLKSYELFATESRYQRAVSVVRANDRLGKSLERGCSCQCCVHTATPLSQIRSDGTFQWEADLEKAEADATMGLDPEQEVSDARV